MYWTNGGGRLVAASNLAWHDEVHRISGVQWVVEFDWNAEQFIALIEITDGIDRLDEQRINGIKPQRFATITEAKQWCEKMESANTDIL